MPCVFNKYDPSRPTDAIFIGRPSKWGNPFIIGRDGTRAQVIEKYKRYLDSKPELKARVTDLRGRDLVCYCAPLACHGDILLELANQGD